MKRFFKTLSVLFFALCVGIFSMIAYGSVYLPDSVTAAHAEQDIGGIYSVNGSGQAESAARPQWAARHITPR